MGDQIMTVLEVAGELRCSKAHVYNLIAGRVTGVLPLPFVPLGRKMLIRRSSLECWIRTNEKHGIIPSPLEIDTVGRMEVKSHA